MMSKVFGTVLSSRVFLTLACTGLLLLVPGVLAGSVLDEPLEDPAAPPSPESTYEAARDHAEESHRETQDRLAEYGIEVRPEEARREASRAVRMVEDEAYRLAEQYGLLTLASDVHDSITNADPAHLIPVVIGTTEPEPEPQDTQVQTAATGEGWEMDSKPLALLAGTAAAAGLIFWIAGSSGTLGGAAAGGAGTTAAQQAAGRRFLPYASPLFTRFEKDTVLDHPKREGLYGMIVMKPGITLQDLCEGTGLSRTAVSHHLRLMEQQHIIVSKRVGRSRHFFENGGRYGRDQKDAYAVLHNDRSKEVHSFIETHPGSIQKDLCDALGIQASVAHWHVKRLVEANLIEAIRQGRTVSYFPSQTLRAVTA